MWGEWKPILKEKDKEAQCKRLLKQCTGQYDLWKYALDVENSWHKHGRPYYKVHPLLVEKLCRAKLDKVPSSMITMPIPAIHFRFLEEHDEVDGIKSFLFGRLRNYCACLVNTQNAYYVLAMTIEPGETIAQAIEGVIAEGQQYDGDFVGLYKNLFSCAITAGFLHDASDEIISHDILKKDRERYEKAKQEHNQEEIDFLIDRASRNHCKGWNLGTNEMFAGWWSPEPSNKGTGERELKYAHIRSGHPHAVRYGKGKSKVKIKWFRPTVVRKDLGFAND